MRQRMFAATAVALMVSVGSVVGVAGTAYAATPAASQVAAVQRDDTPTVCKAAGKTITEGFRKFISNMDKVSSLARSGDLTAAEQSVRESGQNLVDLAKNLKTDATNADDPALKETVNKLADEFDQIGNSLDSLSSLEKFNAKQLDPLLKDLVAKCGPNLQPSPGASAPAWPSDSASPTA